MKRISSYVYFPGERILLTQIISLFSGKKNVMMQNIFFLLKRILKYKNVQI